VICVTPYALNDICVLLCVMNDVGYIIVIYVPLSIYTLCVLYQYDMWSVYH